MGHGYKHRQTKAELVNWLWGYEDDGFWQDLANFVGKDWPSFAKRVKGAWRNAGGTASDVNFLDNIQHCVHIWQLLNEAQSDKKTKSNRQSWPGTSKKDKHLATKAELIDWLWYHESDEFWQKLRSAKKNNKAIARIIKAEWQNEGGDVGALSFLDNSQHCMDVWKVMFEGTAPQLPR